MINGLAFGIPGTFGFGSGFAPGEQRGFNFSTGCGIVTNFSLYGAGAAWATGVSPILWGGAGAAGAGGAATGETVYRVWGGGAGPWGQSWTTVNPSTVSNFRSAAGLPSANSGQFVMEGILKSTEGVTVQIAPPLLSGQTGGLIEYTISNPQKVIELIKVSGANPPF